MYTCKKIVWRKKIRSPKNPCCQKEYTKSRKKDCFYWDCPKCSTQYGFVKETKDGKTFTWTRVPRTELFAQEYAVSILSSIMEQKLLAKEKTSLPKTNIYKAQKRVLKYVKMFLDIPAFLVIPFLSQDFW